MKRLIAATAALLVALSFGAVRASADSISWGVNDNAGLYERADGSFWETMLSRGLTTNTITLRWDETTDSGLSPVDAEDLPDAMAAAREAGVSVEFDVYPRHAKELADPRGPARFAAFLTGLAETYPDVPRRVRRTRC